MPLVPEADAAGEGFPGIRWSMKASTLMELVPLINTDMVEEKKVVLPYLNGKRLQALRLISNHVCKTIGKTFAKHLTASFSTNITNPPSNPQMLGSFIEYSKSQSCPKMFPTIFKLNLNHLAKQQRMFKGHVQFHIQGFQIPTCKIQLGPERKRLRNVAKGCVPLLLFTHNVWMQDSMFSSMLHCEVEATPNSMSCTSALPAGPSMGCLRSV